MESRAYHLAATIVAVHLSRYHHLRGVFDLSIPTEKSGHVVFDAARHSSGSEAAAQAQDPEVLYERAIIDLAGHEAEEIYYIVNHLPIHGHRVNNHESVMDDAMNGFGDLSVPRSELVRQTLELVSRNWFAVRDLARLIMISPDGTLDSMAASQRLERLYNSPAAVG